MSEIEKMYENSGIEKQEPLFCEYFNYSSKDLYERCTRFHKYCADGHFGMKEMCPCGLSKSERENMFNYPSFTAKKQLELIKFFGNRKGYPDYGKFFGVDFDYYAQFYHFDEVLAKTVNTLWQDLTDTEKAEIKRILED